MASKTVKNSSQVITQLNDVKNNPNSLGVPSSAARDRRILHCTIEVEGTSVTPLALFNALDAAFGTVQMNKSQAARGCYIFNISA